MNSEKQSYSCDFETTTDPNDCRVWAWGLVTVDDPDNTFEHGIDIESWSSRMCTIDGIVYFHNLAFDGSFILDYLLKNGFTNNSGRYLKNGELSTVIDDMGKFYSITVKWENGTQTVFRDSMKKLPMSVERIAKSYGLGETKGDIDYHAFREIGHKLTDEELDYLKRDVVIVAKALAIQLREGMVRLTLGSDSLAQYKSIMGTSFTRYFPVLSLEMDAQIRMAYRGGFTYASPRFSGPIVEHTGFVYDVNSLYPSVMYHEPMPYGHPQWFEGFYENDSLYPLYVQSMTVTAKLKPNHIPCIQIKGSPLFSPTQYQTDISEPTTIVGTNVDWELWMDHYDITVLSAEGGFKFHATKGLFSDYIDYWMGIKATETGGKRQIAKDHLNSLYGKFASNPNKTRKQPIIDGDRLRLVRGEEEITDPIYTPVGAFITAYARNKTIRAAQQNFSSFAYADTDSLHLVTDTPPRNLFIHPTELGAWKHEGTFSRARYVRAKCYAEEFEWGTDVHVAGLPRRIAATLTLDDLVKGATFSGKLKPSRVPGGIVLEEIDFTIH